jgi:hypothetical protein
VLEAAPAAAGAGFAVSGIVINILFTTVGA